MGALSALIVGPCVAAPLAGGLLFISQTGNVLLGGLSLFILSLGMGLPLVAVGTSAGHLLPRAGPWMDAIRSVFGMLMLGVAVWFLARILPGPLTLALWSALAVAGGVYLRALEPIPEDAPGWLYFRRAAGVLVLAYGLAMGVGALQGQDNPFRPLMAVRETAGSPLRVSSAASGLHFHHVRSVSALQAALQKARGKPVLLDYWAKWCVECTRMDRVTFADARVRQALAGYVLIRVDVTADDGKSRKLLQKFDLAGPPAFIAYGSEGQVQRVQEGYLGPSAFLHWLGSQSV